MFEDAQLDEIPWGGTRGAGRAQAILQARAVSRLAPLLLLLVAGVAAPASAHAAGGGGQGRPDFRFSQPRGHFAARLGWVFQRADGEIFDFLTDQLTLARTDFNAPTFAAELGRSLSGRIDLVAGVEYASRSRRSEFRDYVDEAGLPIVQDSRLTQVPVTLSLRLYLTDRGRRVSRYVWVPAKFVPYVGYGVGATWYRLEQQGDFVDFIDLTIFSDTFTSDGWTFATHAFAGLEVELNPNLRLLLEGRYQWADAELRGSFVGFDPIDLNGLRTLVGVAWKF